MANLRHSHKSATEPTSYLEPETGMVVVGVDDSPGADHALRWAIAEAHLREARVKAVYAWNPPMHGSGLAEGLTSLEDPMASVKPSGAAGRLLTSVLERAQTDVSRTGRLEGQAVLGHPAFALLDAADDADLIVVGTRGRGGFRGLLLGSTSQACAQHSHRPVAIIPPNVDLPGHGDIVVGVDDSPGARRAVAWAAVEAARREAKLVLVHAWYTPVPVPPAGMVITPIEPEVFRAASVDLLDRVMKEALAGLGASPELELVTVEEPAATALLQRAEHADLLVVGGRGRGGFMGLLLGSVSQQVLHHAPCAVVVVPDPEARPHDRHGEALTVPR